jgi:hypothetical protein
VSWGAADGIVLTDVVCPPNLSAYAGLDFAGSRLPVDGLRLRYGFSSFAVEALWLPLFTPARLPGDKQNPLYGVLYPASVDTGAGGGALPVRVSEAAPPRSLGDGEYGLRFSAYTPAVDVSVALFYGWNDVPYFDKKLSFSGAAPKELELRPGYARTLMAGADVSAPLGEFLLRLEGAWIGGGRYDRSGEDTAAEILAGRSGDPVEKHNLKLLAGLDWNPSGWMLSAQYYEDLLPDAYDAGASAAWALSDSLSLALESDFFTGGIDNRGDYGAYRDLSCLWVKGVFRF